MPLSDWGRFSWLLKMTCVGLRRNGRQGTHGQSHWNGSRFKTFEGGRVSGSNLLFRLLQLPVKTALAKLRCFKPLLAYIKTQKDVPTFPLNFSRTRLGINLRMFVLDSDTARVLRASMDQFGNRQLDGSVNRSALKDVSHIQG